MNEEQWTIVGEIYESDRPFIEDCNQCECDPLDISPDSMTITITE